MSLIGIDLGTSGSRVGAYSVDGQLLVEASRRTMLRRPSPERVETDAEQVLADVTDLLAEVAQAAAVCADPPRALSFSVQGEAVLPVDRAGRALAPAPVSMDRRGASVLTQVLNGIGAHEVQRITGQPVHPMFSIHKIAAERIMWHTNEFGGYRCLGDFVAARLGARAVMDTTMAARTGAYDVSRRQWCAPILANAGVSVEELPEVVLPGTVIGDVSARIASVTGLSAGLPIIVGSHDQAASFWGAGGVPGQRSVYAFGSSDCLTVGSAQRPDGLDGTGLATYPIADNAWLTLAGTAAGGWALEWLTAVLGARDAAERDEILAAPALEPTDLVALPYLAGSGTVDNDPAARGAVIGLTLETTRAQLARSFLEASGYELRKIIAAFATRGVDVGEISAVGSGAASVTSLAIRADAAGHALSVSPGAGSLRGAALQAGVGVGIYADLTAAPVPKASRSVSPDPNNANWFDIQGARYDALYQALKPLTNHHTKESP